jgi:glycogen(starch) synthase
MKIVIVSLYFPPRVGGLENIMYGLAQRWHEMGHTVTVFTTTPGKDRYDFEVIRSLSLLKLWIAVRHGDVFVEANISLKTTWVGFLYRKKWFVIHHALYDGGEYLKRKLKRCFILFSNNIAVSNFIASTLPADSTVIPNFYDEVIFRKLPEIRKDKEIVFLGRLVSDKGLHLLVKALHILASQRVYYTLTVIGEGPERESIIKLVDECHLQDRVEFVGPKKGQELVAILNQHQVLVVPSVVRESFGIVVLEGLACGCKVVVSNGGGLPEAAGSFGVLFKSGDTDDLAKEIRVAMDENMQLNWVQLQNYLNDRTSVKIALKYIEEFLLRL